MHIHTFLQKKNHFKVCELIVAKCPCNIKTQRPRKFIQMLRIELEICLEGLQRLRPLRFEDPCQFNFGSHVLWPPRVNEISRTGQILALNHCGQLVSSFI